MNTRVQPIGIYPRWLAIAPTWKCDSKCKMCDIWTKRETFMMDYHELHSSLAHHFFGGIKDVAFFGGEPTQHDHLPELISVINQRFPEATQSIVTNGIDKDRIIDILQFISKKITKDLLICVSINGTRPRHDELRRIDGAYDNGLQVLKAAKTLFTRSPRISMTLLPDFTNELEHLGYLANALAIDVSLRVAVSGSYFQGKVNDQWTSKQIEFLESELDRVPKKMFAHRSFVEALPRFLRTGYAASCQAHRHTLIVSPDLSTSVCHNLPALCHLKDIPDVWGKDRKWYQIGAQDCFRGKECFFDGPYSVSLLGEL